MPEVIEVMALSLPVTWPSQEDHPVLFVEPAMLGDKGIGGDAAVTSGEFPLTM